MSIDIFEVFNLILGLLLIFQWYSGRAREHTVKNNLLAVRRMIERRQFEGRDILDTIDATLATIGYRSPFLEWSEKKMTAIRAKFRREQNKPIHPTEIEPQASSITAEDIIRQKQKSTQEDF